MLLYQQVVLNRHLLPENPDINIHFLYPQVGQGGQNVALILYCS